MICALSWNFDDDLDSQIDRFDDGSNIADTITKLEKGILRIEDIPPLNVFVDEGRYMQIWLHWSASSIYEAH